MRRFRVVFKKSNIIGGNAMAWILLTDAITLDFLDRYIKRLSKWYGSDYEIEYMEGDI